MSSAAEAAAKWGKSLDVEEADPTPSGQCHKAAFMGGVAGAVMGGMYGAVDGFTTLSKQKPRPAGKAFTRQLGSMASSKMMAGSGFFTIYHTSLCGLRYYKVNKDHDMLNVAIASAVAVVPFYRSFRSNFVVFGLLVALDVLPQGFVTDTITGRGGGD